MDATRTQRSKGELFAALDENEDKLLRFLVARTRDHALAEDLMQSARVKLLEDKDKSNVTNHLPYLYRLLENLVRDHMRSERSRDQRNRDWGDKGEGVSEFRADTITPERATLERDYLTRVLAALDTLPERTRLIFLAYRVDGVSQKEIAVTNDISLSAVEKHLQRAYRLVATLREKSDAGVEG